MCNGTVLEALVNFSRMYFLSRIRMSMVVIVGGVKVELLHHTTAALLGDKVGINNCSARFRTSGIVF